ALFRTTLPTKHPEADPLNDCILPRCQINGSSMNNTSSMWSQIACNKVTEHEMHFFFEFDGIPLRGIQITLGDLSAPTPDWIPADQFAALAGRYRNESIWTKTTDRGGSYFYAHLQDIVAERRKELATLWCLPAPAKAFLENAELYEHDVPRTDR